MHAGEMTAMNSRYWFPIGDRQIQAGGQNLVDAAFASSSIDESPYSFYSTDRNSRGKGFRVKGRVESDINQNRGANVTEQRFSRGPAQEVIKSALCLCHNRGDT